jgi:hypothetical protein
MRTLTTTITLLAALAFGAFAAEDPNGTWKGSLETPNGTQEITFNLKLDAGKITGSVNLGMMGTVQISSGKLEEDKISFAITADFGEITFAGSIKADEMNLTMTAGGGQFTVPIAAKRVKTVDHDLIGAISPPTPGESQVIF